MQPTLPDLSLPVIPSNGYQNSQTSTHLFIRFNSRNSDIMLFRNWTVASHTLPSSDIISHFGDLFAFSMDWQGQKLAEQLMQILLLAFAAVAFVVGYVMGSFQTMILIYAGGAVFTSLITVPNWPWFNRHPLQWLDPSEAEKHPKPQQPVNSKKKPAKK